MPTGAHGRVLQGEAVRVFMNCSPTTQAPRGQAPLTVLTTALQGQRWQSHPHSTQEQTEAQRGLAACLASHSQVCVAGQDLTMRPPQKAANRPLLHPGADTGRRHGGPGSPGLLNPNPTPSSGNYRKAQRGSKTPPSQARRCWHPGLFPLVSWSDPLREGRREADSPLCGLFPRPNFPTSSEPPDTTTRGMAGLSWALCLPGRSGCSRGDLFLFPTQEPLRGRVKTLLSSRPFSAPSPPTWSKARVLSVPPAPRPSVRPLPLQSISCDHPCQLSCPTRARPLPHQSPRGSPPHLLLLS